MKFPFVSLLLSFFGLQFAHSLQQAPFSLLSSRSRLSQVPHLPCVSSHLIERSSLVRRRHSHMLHPNLSHTTHVVWSMVKDDDGEVKGPTSSSKKSTFSQALRLFTLFAPLWTLGASAMGSMYPLYVGNHLGSLTSVSRSLSTLMFIMGFTTTPNEVRAAFVDSSSIKVLVINAICCFILMPGLSLIIPNLIPNSSDALRQGTMLLGCVGGGQASNLFSLLAGGDVSLSVVCTLSTTILAALGTTPALASLLLKQSIPIDMHVLSVLRSTAFLILFPLLSGLSLRRILPESWTKEQIIPYCPALGVLLTMCLVAGGAANSASSLLGSNVWQGAAICATLLPVFGGLLALGIGNFLGIDPAPKRTLVIEVLSKSPTVAYVLALTHFGGGAAAAVPAAGMVSLAVVGAAVASAWSISTGRGRS